jgi:hypothetical protein
LAQHLEETRLDQLWHAVASGGAEADWLRFYEGFAVQRLIVPVDEGSGDGGVTAATARLTTLRLEAGEVVLAFDTEARFAAFIAVPTEFVALIGADLARALARRGIGVALNPGVAPGETVLDPQALAWIAAHAGAEVAVEEMPGGTRIRPPADPEAAMLDALGTRLAEMTGHIAEAWLVGAATPDGGEAYLCIIRTASEAAGLGPEIAAELTRIGQIRASRSFSVAIVEEKTRLLTAARRIGIGLAG